MLEQQMELWDAHAQGHWVCVTTNGVVRKGHAVMGAGIAKEAAKRFPWLPEKLGEYLRQFSNRVFWFPTINLITFPTKFHFRDDSDINLIRASAKRLVELVNRRQLKGPIYLPRPGCGFGHLAWEEVRPILEPILDDRFVVVHR